MSKVIDFNKVDITKDFILSQVTESDIFEYYTKEPVKLNKLIRSPLHKDNTPSFNIIQSSYTRGLLFKDFGDGSHGNCFELVKRLYNCDYNKALEIVSNDLKLSTSGIKVIEERKSNPIEDIIQFQKKIITIPRAFKKLDYDYWNSFYIPLEYLVHDNTHACNYVYLHRTPDEIKLWGEHKDDNPIYCYNISGKQKIYRPLNPTKAGKWLTTCTSLDLQGLEFIDKRGEILFITSSMKERWVLKVLGQKNSIAPGGEGIPIPESIMNYLFACYDEIILFYDNDEAGKKCTLKFQEKYPEIRSIFIPDEYVEKEISDTIRRYGINETQILLDSLI